MLVALLTAALAVLLLTGPANSAPTSAPAPSDWSVTTDPQSGVQISLPGEVKSVPLEDGKSLAYATSLENGSLTLTITELDPSRRDLVAFWEGAAATLTDATTSYETSEVDDRAVLDGRASGFNSKVAGGGADVFMRMRVIDGGEYLISVITMIRQDSGTESETDQIQRQALETLRIPEGLRSDASSRDIDTNSVAYRVGEFFGTGLVVVALAGVAIGLFAFSVWLVFRLKRAVTRQDFGGSAGAPGQRFNSPPGWPPVPPGWQPPPGWKPDPAWPPAPPNWQWWVS